MNALEFLNKLVDDDFACKIYDSFKIYGSETYYEIYHCYSKIKIIYWNDNRITLLRYNNCYYYNIKPEQLLEEIYNPTLKKRFLFNIDLFARLT